MDNFEICNPLRAKHQCAISTEHQTIKRAGRLLIRPADLI
jgi:hypothetical protein